MQRLRSPADLEVTIFRRTKSKSPVILLVTSFALAVGLGLSSDTPARAGSGDCIDATCSGVASCSKLKRACGYGGGTFVAKTRNDKGETTSGSCSICY